MISSQAFAYDSDPLFEDLAEFVLEDPQLPDTTGVSMTNELIGGQLVKIAVRRGVKKAKKEIRKNGIGGAVKKVVAPHRIFPCKGASIRIVTYNVGTFTKSGYDRTDLVSAMMKEAKADIVGLSELDRGTRRNGGKDQLKDFCGAMGGDSSWEYQFTPALPDYDGGEYGIGILSKTKYTPVDRWSITLAKGKGNEQRALSVVEFKKFVLAATHLDNKSGAVQVNQVKELTNAITAKYAGSGKTVILCGDMNAIPGSATLKELKKSWTVVSDQGDTCPSDKPKKCIDYILVLNNGARYKVKHTGVCTKFKAGDPAEASDHLPVYADIKAR